MMSVEVERTLESDSECDEDFHDADEGNDSFLDNLSSAIEHAKVSLGLFLNNHFGEAKDRLKPFVEGSFYHAHGTSTIMTLEAVMTFQPEVISAAQEALRTTVDICNNHRKKNTMLESLNSLVRGVDYNSFTEVEAHAEICYAESLFLQAVLTLIQDENMVGFVKSGIKVKSAYASYKAAYYMVKNRTWNGAIADQHFRSSVHFGVGVFHLLISLLPPKVLKLLQFIGFSGERSIGLRELERGHELQHTTHGPLCTLILLSYYLLTVHLIDDAEVDLDYVQNKLMMPFMASYPLGSLTKIFLARLHVLRGSFNDAVFLYKEAAQCQKEWKHFNHLSYWDSSWSWAFLCEWREAITLVDILFRENRWSKLTYAYFKASCMCMLGDQLTKDEKTELNDLMQKIPKWKQKVAGKSIPIEKFALAKSKQYLECNNSLVIPALELMYCWGTFYILKNNAEALNKIYGLACEALDELTVRTNQNSYYWDDRCMTQLVKAVCLRLMDDLGNAEKLLHDLCCEEKKINKAVHLVPCAYHELGLLYIQTGQFDLAQAMLTTALSKAKGPMENKLYIHCQSALNRLKGARLEKGDSGDAIADRGDCSIVNNIDNSDGPMVTSL